MKKPLSRKSKDHVLLLIALAFFTLAAVLIKVAHGQTVIHQTIPGTDSRDYAAPSTVIEWDESGRNGTGYQTIPGTMSRDYAAPGITVRRDNARTHRDQYRDDEPLQQGQWEDW